MIFDTTSGWTIINTADVDCELPSNFDLQESTSAKKDSSMDDQSVTQASAIFSGRVYHDKMCFYQTRQDRNDQTGRMCVR